MIEGIGRAGSTEEGGVPDPSLSLEAFPGRWNPRRGLPPEIDPIPAATARALEDAGWWRPGSGEGAPGALVVACDHGSWIPAARFARALEEGSTPSPGDFLFSLPSSAAAVLGILFGLRDYQATLVGAGGAGLAALRHALDLLAMGRQQRIVVAALSVGGPSHEDPPGPCRLAAAWCLSSSPPGGRYPARIELEGRTLRLAIDGGEDGKELPRAPAAASWEFRDLAAWPLIQASRWLEDSRRTPVSETLHAKIKEMLVRQLKLKLSPEEIEDDAPLFGEGLGLDSIDVLEVVASIEKEFGIAIRSQEEGERVLKSVRSIAEFLREKSGAG